VPGIGGGGLDCIDEPVAFGVDRAAIDVDEGITAGVLGFA